MSRTIGGRQHPDRDAQFRRINAMIAEFRAAGDPVVPVDAKKKEQPGPYHRHGRTWRPAGDPVRVRDHDFPDEELGKITPYGIYDIAANRGFVSAGTSCGTAAFAVNALRGWWQREGASRYPGARRLLVTCDADTLPTATGAAPGRDQLAVLAGQAGLAITVMHFPPGTSKWNKTGHRLFCHITRTWRGRPLMTPQDAVAGIAATTTYAGLKVTAVADANRYPAGQETGDKRMRYPWSPCTLVDRFPLCRIYIRNVNRFLKPQRTHFPQAALFPDAVVIPLDVVEYRGPDLVGIQPQMLVDELLLDRGIK